MIRIAILLLASAAASAMASAPAAEPSAAVAPAPAAGPASLVFVAEYRVLAGSLFGIDGVEGQSPTFTRHVAAEIPAGLATVRYTCPGTPPGGARLAHEFVAGQRYELVCHAGEAAEIRVAEGC